MRGKGAYLQKNASCFFKAAHRKVFEVRAAVSYNEDHEQLLAVEAVDRLVLGGVGFIPGMPL